jgi:hypothetical protein
MRTARYFFLLGLGIAVVALAFVVYQMFWGSDAIQLEGKSLGQLLEGGELLALAIIPLFLIITGLAVLPFVRILLPGEIRNGVTATARVLKVRDTGVSINDNPQVGLLLEVTPLTEAAFQAEGKLVVSRLNAALVQPGVAAEVRYDPRNHARLQVVGLTLSPLATGSTAARLEELAALRKDGLITAEEYEQKRQAVLAAL